MLIYCHSNSYWCSNCPTEASFIGSWVPGSLWELPCILECQEVITHFVHFLSQIWNQMFPPGSPGSFGVKWCSENYLDLGVLWTCVFGGAGVAKALDGCLLVKVGQGALVRLLSKWLPGCGLRERTFWEQQQKRLCQEADDWGQSACKDVKLGSSVGTLTPGS